MKKLILASVLAALSSTTLAADYYVVVPLPHRESSENISVSLSTTSLPGGMVGQAYAGFDFSTGLVVKGDPKFNGTGVKWSVIGGALPAGLALGADGKLTGVPAVAGTADFQLQASYKNKAGQQAYQVVVGEINVALASASLPQGVEGKQYSYDFAARVSITGDTDFNPANVTWRVVSGRLPAGLVLAADGKLSGTLTGAGTSNFQVQAAYKTRAGQQGYQVVVGAVTVLLAGATLPDGQQGTAYVYNFKPQLSVSGDPNYNPSAVAWSAVSPLPGGLELNSNGTLTGTPTAGGTSSIEISARYLNKTTSRVYPLTVAALAPDLRLAATPATSQTFGIVATGTAAISISFAIVNAGNAAGALALPAFVGENPADFSVSTTCTNVAPKATCQVAVGFKPVQTGIRSATLNIAGTAFSFSGTGQQLATSYVLLTSGTSYQIPVGVTTVKAWAVGGGGGGAGAYAADAISGGGGGAGGTAIASFTATPGQTLTYTVGAGGTGGYGGANGVSGGVTTVSYGSIALKGYGGLGGYFNAGAAAGGVASGGDASFVGGVGAGSTGDQGGGGGGGIGDVAGTHSGAVGGTGARGGNVSGLHEALVAAGQTVGNPGTGANSSSSNPNSMNGLAATGYGHGGGGAGWYGGNGGNGSRGGGGGGAAGYKATQSGGNGGPGFIVLKLN